MISKEEAIRILKKYNSSKVRSISRVREGVSSIVYRIIISNDEIYYFKQGDVNYKIQYLINEKLNKLGIKTPIIVDYSKTWFLIRGVKGHVVNLQNNKNWDFLRKLGQQVSILHNYKTSGFGPMVSLTEGKFDSYTNYYKKIEKTISPNYIDLIHKYLKKDHNTNLNHGDLFPSHTYMNLKGEYLALIDWDDVVSAPNKYDLSEFLLHIHNDQKIWNLFMEGYSENSMFIKHDDKDLLTEELMQAYDSYQWETLNTIKDEVKLARKKTRIEKVEKILNKYI